MILLNEVISDYYVVWFVPEKVFSYKSKKGGEHMRKLRKIKFAKRNILMAYAILAGTNENC